MHLGILFSFALIIQANGAIYEGETCDKDGRQGICRNVRNCDAAIKEVMQGIIPQRCFFDGFDLIVCCLDNQMAPSSQPLLPVQNPVTTIATAGSQTNADGHCQPVKSTLTSHRTGIKAWDKCIEYQEKYVYPCDEDKTSPTYNTRANNCARNANGTRLRRQTIAVEDAFSGEFPIMALLGFGKNAANAKWFCGGTIISEKFIMTAGHCVFSREVGSVEFIRLGTWKMDEPLNPLRIHRVGKIFHHPEHKSPIRYNDIALVESESEMRLDQFAMPACLPVGNLYDESTAVAIGFGVTMIGGPAANTLHKVKLTKFSSAECTEHYPPQRLMKEGFHENTQMCFGDKKLPKDTCQGDGGGPLLVDNERIHCMYTVVGIISFGKGCGYIGVPAIYTKVSAYVPWIESVVWPG